ncbi:MAG TPA: serine hydrolase domain-containing protein [Rhodanobacter sp.]|jgi:D-alanyl-D-alanine carboxypeptidase|nr:serine hydrolase domain-containing protein [Rhodanobacter sp.]
MIVRWAGIAGLVGVLATPAFSRAAEPSPHLPPAVSGQIDGDIKAFLKQFDVAGAAIAVVERGQVVYTQAYGLRSRAGQLPVRTDTPFEIGSITKQFTAAAILQLQEAGKLSIDAPLAAYLPDAPHAKEVTLKQLLSHTSGLQDYLNGPEPESEIDRLASRPMSYKDLVARVQNLPLAFAPGSRWSYSNTGYLLLGRVIEVVSGENYRDYLQRHILGPVGMRHTFTYADAVQPTGIALGYRHVEGKLERSPDFHPDWSGAAGFLISTLSDLQRWDRALESGQVVSVADYNAMKSEIVTTDGEKVGYGLGLFLSKVFDQPRIGHTGGAQGFTTADEYFPLQGTRIIVLTNSGDKNPEAGEAITNIVFAHVYPKVVAKADEQAANEPTGVNAIVRSSFGELQAGMGYQSFTTKLGSRLMKGPGKKLVTQFAGYGDVSRAIFKGAEEKDHHTWYRYVLIFSPGVRIDYGVSIDGGQVAGVSFG